MEKTSDCLRRLAEELDKTENIEDYMKIAIELQNCTINLTHTIEYMYYKVKKMKERAEK